MKFAPRLRPSLALLAFALLASTLGCGSGRNLKPVAGEVQLNGKPLAGCQITFVPISTVTGVMRPATGATDANGKFKLSTYDPNDGATPGEYKVTVEWTPPANVQLSGESGFEAMRESRKGHQPPPASPVHMNYSRVDKTPLTVNVPHADPLVLKLTAEGT